MCISLVLFIIIYLLFKAAKLASKFWQYQPRWVSNLPISLIAFAVAMQVGLILIYVLANSIEITCHPNREKQVRDYVRADLESPQSTAQQTRELRSLSPSVGFAAAAAEAPSQRRATSRVIAVRRPQTGCPRFDPQKRQLTFAESPPWSNR